MTSRKMVPKPKNKKPCPFKIPLFLCKNEFFSCNFLHNFISIWFVFFLFLLYVQLVTSQYIDDFTLNTPLSLCNVPCAPLPSICSFILVRYTYALLAPHTLSSIVFIDIFYPGVIFLRSSHFIFHSVFAYPPTRHLSNLPFTMCPPLVSHSWASYQSEPTFQFVFLL